ncbi:Alpha/Beta hydrolase protein [Gymnopilus junonius]|uniref:Carboxylic ester hydrolase n=1 Tax=Gymnopilus junonius TaxID=109634 RepID=A0A9P5NFZ4_GYMJU|nr:Alpha/Beta hydrolase protein [Gymnopilus junonius]
MRMLHTLGLFISISALAKAAPAPLVVNLGYAQYQGVTVQDKVTNATHTQFLGIRYAAPPTGSLRFRAPASPAFTAGVQLANTEPSMCFQASDGAAATNPFHPGSSSSLTARAAEAGQSEDCLFLNVHVPGILGQKKNLPVVFWIHGGGYVAGSASQFDGNDLIRESGEEVVAVVIQYRLGVFGFLPGQAVKDGGALNAGLLDQQFALKWVQQHITLFGGDPQQVTIWGESAGAGSVLQHVVANGGRTFPPLFRAAMTSSTFLPSQYKFNDPIPEARHALLLYTCLLFNETLEQTQCSSTTDALKCLRQVDVNTLQAANTQINSAGFFGTFVFVPVVDGTFITDRPTQVLKNKRTNGDIILTVTNAFEGTSFVDQTTAAVTAPADYVTQLFPNFEATQIQAAAAHYAGLGSNAFVNSAIMGESIFICPTYLLLRSFNGVGFKGEFAIPPALHGQDVAYYFTNGETPGFGNPQFDKAFAEAFLDFVKFLNTNIKSDPQNTGTPLWPTWSGSNEMLFNMTTAGAPDIHVVETSSALLQRCE